MVRSDRGDEYFGRHTEAGRMPGLFARFLEGCGIVALYSIPGMASQNGVADRINRTLIDIW